MTDHSGLYAFAYRGQLTEAALDKAGRRGRQALGMSLEDLGDILNFDLLDNQDLSAAAQMAAVYTAIAAFERSARRFVSRVLVDEFGDDWWEVGVAEGIRKNAAKLQEAEANVKYHGARAESPLDYTMLGDLAKVIANKWDLFEAHLPRQDWVTQVIGAIEQSRNVIMHSGTLDIEDIERVGMNVRDWLRQVGA
jgi:hypothetical protein